MKGTVHFPSYPSPHQHTPLPSIHNVAICVHIICMLKFQCASGITHKGVVLLKTPCKQAVAKELMPLTITVTELCDRVPAKFFPQSTASAQVLDQNRRGAGSLLHCSCCLSTHPTPKRPSSKVLVARLN